MAKTIKITNGKVTKDVTAAQWKNMQDFPHQWKPAAKKPKELKDKKVV